MEQASEVCRLPVKGPPTNSPMLQPPLVEPTGCIGFLNKPPVIPDAVAIPPLRIAFLDVVSQKLQAKRSGCPHKVSAV